MSMSLFFSVLILLTNSFFYAKVKPLHQRENAMRLPEVTSMEIMQFNQVEPLDQSKAFINSGYFDRDGQILLNHTTFNTPLNNGSCNITKNIS